MKFEKKITLYLICSLFCVTVIFQGAARAASIDEIFTWVSFEMGIQEKHAVPEINFVSKKKLNEIILRKFNESYKSSHEVADEEQAQKMLKIYLEEIRGLFLPENHKIYIGDFMEESKTDEIVAHEIVHYFQQFKKEGFMVGAYGMGGIKLFRELEAEKIQQKFRSEFYPDDNNLQ